MAAAPAKPPVEKLDPKVVKTALILIVGAMAVIFDTTIVSVALHTLALRMHTSVPTIQWVTTGYLLALGIAVPLSAWGLQRFGGKRLWMFSLAVFLVGSIGWRGLLLRRAPQRQRRLCAAPQGRAAKSQLSSIGMAMGSSSSTQTAL